MLIQLLIPDPLPESDPCLIEAAVQFIRQHARSPLTLQRVADHVCMRLSYFAHQFKAKMGFSPMNYMINTRMEQAKSLLVRTNKCIAEIVDAVGYASAGSFMNTFTKRMGQSPKQYRMTLQGNAWESNHSEGK